MERMAAIKTVRKKVWRTSNLKISRLMIKNYTNLRDIDIYLNGTVALIGENNSGKSNLLRAVTLPFLTDETGYSGKNLS